MSGVLQWLIENFEKSDTLLGKTNAVGVVI